MKNNILFFFLCLCLGEKTFSKIKNTDKSIHNTSSQEGTLKGEESAITSKEGKKKAFFSGWAEWRILHPYLYAFFVLPLTCSFALTGFQEALFALQTLYLDSEKCTLLIKNRNQSILCDSLNDLREHYKVSK